MFRTMKTLTKILAIWGCIVTLPFVCILCVYLDREGIVEFRSHPGVDYYYPADLQKMNLPSWNQTNAIPLSPDSAMRAASAYATKKHPGVTTWEADRISLEREGSSATWTYTILLIDRQTGSYADENVRVLMDGSIWEPSKEERKR
jgi:hypothetical protein